MALRNLLCSALVALSACAPKGPVLSEQEAHNVLRDFARGDAPADVCTPEGRALLRSAARTYSEAEEKAGREWPNIPRIMQEGAPDLTDIDAMAIAALATGFIEPSDVRGPVGDLAAMIGMVHGVEIGRLHRSIAYACPEVFALQQAVGRYTILIQRYERDIQRAERHGPEYERDVRERYADRIVRIQHDMQRLSNAVEVKLKAAPQSQGL